MAKLKPELREILDRYEISPTDNDECWIWTRSKDTHGYGQVRHAGRTRLVHRLVYEIAFGVNPTGFVVMHKCDQPACINPSHLVLGTQRDNIADRHTKGRDGAARGDDAPWSKLTSEQVASIRRMCVEGEPRRAILRQFPISKSQFYRIKNRMSWGHI